MTRPPGGHGRCEVLYKCLVLGTANRIPCNDKPITREIDYCHCQAGVRDSRSIPHKNCLSRVRKSLSVLMLNQMAALQSQLELGYVVSEANPESPLLNVRRIPSLPILMLCHPDT